MTLISADNCWHDWLEIVGSCTSHGSESPCRNRCQQRCQSADITVADVLRVSVIYIGYYMLFGHSNWWIVTCGWRFGLFVLINTTIDIYYCSLPFILRRNWRTLCTWSPIHCAGVQFTHDTTVNIQLINTSTHPCHSWPYYAITAFHWNSLRIVTGTTNWVTARRR